MRKRVKNIFSRWLTFMVGSTTAAYAFASSYSIGTGGGSAFNTITTVLQDWVDFMTGPMGKAVVLGSIIIGVIVWAILPKADGILGYAFRGLIAGAVIFNIATWMGIFGGGH